LDGDKEYRDAFKKNVILLSFTKTEQAIMAKPATSLSDEEKEVILSVNCPHLLFPYARRILSGVTIDGGFPPLMISPVDFLTLYKQRKGSVDEQLVN
jgi:protein-export chaperone SecB